MIKQLLIAGITLLIAATAQAESVREASVPDAVKNTFTSLHPNTHRYRWETEDGNYDVGFEDGETRGSLVIAPGGKLLETGIEIPASALPQAAVDYLVKTTSGSSVKVAGKIVDNTGRTTYEAEAKEVTCIFDDKGKFLRTEED